MGHSSTFGKSPRPSFAGRIAKAFSRPRPDPNPNGEQTSWQPGDSSANKTSGNQRDFGPADTPEFPPTEQEINRRDLEEVRRNFNTQSLSFEAMQIDRGNNCINGAIINFYASAHIAAKNGSRVARFGLNPYREELQALITSQKARDEACAFIYREYGIQPDRVSFGTATRVTHGSEPQHLLWMDIDFG